MSDALAGQEVDARHDEIDLRAQQHPKLVALRALRKAVLAAPGMVAARALAVGDTVGCTSDGIVGSTLNGFGHSRL